MQNKTVKRILLVLLCQLAYVLSICLTALFTESISFSALFGEYRTVLLTDFLLLTALLVLFGLDTASLILAGISEAFKLLSLCLILFATNLLQGFFPPYPSHRWTVLHFFFLTLFLSLALFTPRLIKHLVNYKIHLKSDRREKIIVVGAGEAGSALVHDMLSSKHASMYPVCFADDDPNKLSTYIYGVKVAGTINDLPKICEKYDADRIAVAIPSASPSRIKDILSVCQATQKKVVLLPGLLQIVKKGNLPTANLREVDVQDLLGRDPIRVNMDEIRDRIRGKTVLVTGGGGSIGSELCRQLANYSPSHLIVFDIYENNAYDLQQELSRKHPELRVTVLIGSVRDQNKVERLFSEHKPQIVFHAAAHKHVPLMEASPNEAVKNNVLGTRNVAFAAAKNKTETFVQISTDKAVNPTSMMGATKRIGEMIVQALGKHSTHTKFVAVRFGNVLGSNGSVIPLFKRQIAEGGPVTVTHKDIIRYFMTITEAVSLVLQACCYANAGEIFVFDMGEQVRIYDLAENLIRLSGYTPGVDMHIVCVGLRPGEKLFEECLIEEGLQTTPNEKIRIEAPQKIDEDELFSRLEELETATEAESAHTAEIVKSLVPTYQPQNNPN